MGAANRIWYRIWQLWTNLSARPLSPQQGTEVTRLLDSQEYALFCRLSVPDQQHSYRVMRKLHEAGHHQPDLLKAALLHDVGKCFATAAWWDRIAVVLGQRLAPEKADGWSRSESAGWARAFVIKSQHAQWGAEGAASAGSSAVTVELIRRHHDSLEAGSEGSDGRLLTLLQWADDNG